MLPAVDAVLTRALEGAGLQHEEAELQHEGAEPQQEGAEHHWKCVQPGCPVSCSKLALLKVRPGILI